MKKILGLDLGTNSIGWALIATDENDKPEKIEGMGSRIIPMSQDILGDFEKGNSVSQTATRTGYRGMRRLHERHLLRRERLQRVLNLLGYLPKYFANALNEYGQFKDETEVKLPYFLNDKNKFEFLFKKSYNEMLEDFRRNQPQLLANVSGKPKLIPYDWTIYYLRKKALTDKIEKEELAWLLLNFNQKRGYYQLRGEDEDKKEDDFQIITRKIISVTKGEKDKKYNKHEYISVLEDGLVYKASFYSSIENWVGQTREFILTYKIKKDKKTNTELKEPSLSYLPTIEEIEAMDATKKAKMYSKIKIKTEKDINDSNKTVGTYIYDTLLKMPQQKIKGKLVRTIERSFYKEELEKILDCQIKNHPELQDAENYKTSINVLYESNEEYKNSISNLDFKYLFVENIIFYQRPLKSKKSEISDCTFEFHPMKNKDGKLLKDENGKQILKPLKCISRSHPLFQEFRLWQWLQNVKIYEREKQVNDKWHTDINVSNEFLKNEDDYVNLYEYLNERKDVDQKAFLKHFKLNIKTHRWNFIDDDKKVYPCNETHNQITNRLAKVEKVPDEFLTKEKETALWHILYSVRDKHEIVKALTTFAKKHSLHEESFVENFKKYPLIKSEYGSYSEKAIKKLLPLMRMGKYWDKEAIHKKTRERIEKIINGEYDSTIQNRVHEKAINLTEINHFRALPLWLASYIVYDRHSESSETSKWKSLADLENYLKNFKQHSLRNPIVEQVTTETLRVVKDIWSHYGEGKENFFNEIHIELGREMKNNAEDRKAITESNIKNESTNLRIRAMLAEFAKPEFGIEGVRPYSPYQQDALKIFEDGIINSGIDIPEDIEKISKSSQPTDKEILKYKLWLEQRYRSPYTGEIIPLSRLFTSDYEIEHIIPQSIYFDDSFSNKVICESEINKLKDKQLGYEFIRNHGTEKVTLSGGKVVSILTIKDYEDFIKNNYAKNKGKAKKLMLDEIPDKMIERQLNDTRYISNMIKNLLSNLVRAEKDDDGVTSKNIISTNGTITSILKQDWGLNDVWNDLMLPRFERLNKLTGKDIFTTYNSNYQKYLPTLPLNLRKGFQLKRIDHRHHAMDALVIACATRNHVNYLNNQTALDKTKKKNKDEKQKDRYDLRNSLCFKTHPDTNENYKWQFNKPWENFTQDAKKRLETIVVSFKQNLRVINKSVNKFDSYKDDNGNLRLDKNGKPIKGKRTQIKGDNWAIRKSLHTPMPYGKKHYSFDILKITDNIGKREFIIDDNVRTIVENVYQENNKKVTTTQNYLKKNPILNQEGNPIIETAFKINNEKYRQRQPISKLSNRSSKGGILNLEQAIKYISKVADFDLQRDLLNHLKFNENNIDKAFSAEGIEKFNASRKIPIYKLPIAESGSKRFQLGEKKKYVESETNLFFAVYSNKDVERKYKTIPFNEVIENQKQGAKEKKNYIDACVPPIYIDEKSKVEYNLLFSLSPNDLVYMPTQEEIENPAFVNVKKLNTEQIKRVFTVNDFSGNIIYFSPNSHAKNIAEKEVDLSWDDNKKKLTGSFDNKTTSFSGTLIKEKCWKLKVDRLGNISL